MDIRLTDYDYIVVNSSGGKDSQTALRFIAKQAAVEEVSDRVLVAHADLGQVEWDGTKDLAQRQAEHYGFRFLAIARPQGDLLQHIAHCRHRLQQHPGLSAAGVLLGVR